MQQYGHQQVYMPLRSKHLWASRSWTLSNCCHRHAKGSPKYVYIDRSTCWASTTFARLKVAEIASASAGQGAKLTFTDCCMQRTMAAAAKACSRMWLPGTQVWAKLRGSAAWPVAIWSFELCQRKDAPQLLTSFIQGIPTTFLFASAGQ